MSHLAIAGLQLELCAEDNLSTIESEIEGVKKRFPWIQMIVLPELCTFGASPDLAVELPGEVETCYRELAARNNIWLIPGSLFERRNGEICNTAPVISPAGEVVARYAKRYPFYPYEHGIARGDEFVVFDVPGVGRVGLMICFDMWHPEMARQLAWMGAEVIIIPTLTNTIDRHVELSIAKALAAINQVYVVNINNAGRLGNGQSIVVGPDGTLIHQAPSTREIITVELDLNHVRHVRERGLHGCIQSLKSFRDANITYPVYQKGAGSGSLESLGDLKMPAKQPEEK